MKVKFKHLLNGYTGTTDDSVIYYMQRLGQCVIRRRPRRHDNAGQDKFRVIMRNLFFIHPSQGYKQDLRAYIVSYQELVHNHDKGSITWNNIYMKLMFEMQRTTSGIDLSTITREQIYSLNLPCISVKMAIEAGLLPVVSGYENLIGEL